MCMCVAVCLLYAVVASLCVGLQGIASASAEVRMVQHFANGCHACGMTHDSPVNTDLTGHGTSCLGVYHCHMPTRCQTSEMSQLPQQPLNCITDG